MANSFSALASSNFNNSSMDNNCGISTSIIPKQSQFSDEWGDIDSFCTKHGFYQDFATNQEQQQMLPVSSSSYYEQIHQLQDAPDHQPPFSQDSSNAVSNFPGAFKNVDGANTIDKNSKRSDGVSQKLSTEQILRLAGERFVQFSTQKFIDTNMSTHPYSSSLSHLSAEDKQDVELAQLLLAAAENVGNHQLERASRLLSSCRWISSNVGSPVQRAVCYFAEALMERINKEEGCSDEKNEYVDACLNSNVLALLAMYQELPFFQVVHFTAAQTILENVGNKSKVHLIDFHVATGIHWAAFMQAVTEQTRDQNGYLKITAIETAGERGAERTGKLLKGFATYLNLPFSYNVVFLSDVKDLRQEDFGIEPDESVAVLFSFTLRTLITKPNCLKNLMTIMQEINPSVIVISEVEANHNSPSFVTRFIEALFYYGVLFDSLEESMAGDSKSRMEIESGLFREGILNIVAAEGYQRLTRSVTINVWRAFFARFGMQELELTTASLYQACLIVNQFPSGKSCTLDASTKCLLVGWKGTPLFSLSAWKFS